MPCVLLPMQEYQCKGFCGGRWFLLNKPEATRSFEKCKLFQIFETKLYLQIFETKLCNGGKGCYSAEQYEPKGGCSLLVNLTLLQASLVQIRRGQSHLHSSVHCRRKGKRCKTETQMFLRSSHFPLPVQQEEC